MKKDCQAGTMEENNNHLARQTLTSNDAIDITKFICSLMVVVIHTKPLLPYSVMWNVYTAEGLCRIAVPFFFVVSGMFLFRKLSMIQNGDRKSEWDICLHQIGKNGRLYLLWSILYFGIDLVKSGISWEILAEKLRLLLCDASCYHFWYLLALIYAIPLLCLICRWKRSIHVCIIGLGWLYRCLWYAYRWIPGGELIPWSTQYFDAVRNTIFCAIPMMAIGFLCWQDYKRKTQREWFFFVGLCLICNLAELTALFLFSPQKVHFEYLLSMPGLVYCLVNWLLNIDFRFHNRCIPKILRMSSIWIYCSHVAFIVLLGWFHTSAGIRRYVCVMLCLLVSTAIYVWIKQIMGRKEGRTGLWRE